MIARAPLARHAYTNSLLPLHDANRNDEKARSPRKRERATDSTVQLGTANGDFFGLFKDFEEFVAHFLLQDLVTCDSSSVRFLMPFDDFTSRSVPGDLETYKAYRQKTIDFITARNQRILQLADSLPDLDLQQGLFNTAQRAP